MDSRNNFLGHCIIGAVETASDYWCEFRMYEYGDEENVHCEAHESDAENEDRNPNWTRIDNAAIERGIEIVLKRETKINQSYKNTIWGASQTNDASNLDDTTFDAILQCAILGDVIYG